MDIYNITDIVILAVFIVLLQSYFEKIKINDKFV
jgi:hypothetical protein